MSPTGVKGRAAYQQCECLASVLLPSWELAQQRLTATRGDHHSPLLFRIRGADKQGKQHANPGNSV